MAQSSPSLAWETKWRISKKASTHGQIVKKSPLGTSLEKAMAPHSSTLAWKIPWTDEPGRLWSMGSLRAGHDWATSLSLFTFHFHALEKEMATHSSVLAWRIPGRGKPGGLPSMGSHRVGHNWSDLAAAAAGTSLVVRWLRLHTSNAGVQVQSLVRELDPTCCN